MVGVLSEPAERGLVERVPDPADRRRDVITISTRGRRRLSLLDETPGGLEGELLAPLSPSERDQLVRLPTRLLDHHASHPDLVPEGLSSRLDGASSRTVREFLDAPRCMIMRSDAYSSYV